MLLLGISRKVIGLPKDMPLACILRPIGLFCLNIGGGRLIKNIKGLGEGLLGILLLSNKQLSLMASLFIIARAFLSIAMDFIRVLISRQRYYFL